jgi:hypothetical protein
MWFDRMITYTPLESQEQAGDEDHDEGTTDPVHPRHSPPPADLLTIVTSLVPGLARGEQEDYGSGSETTKPEKSDDLRLSVSA